MVTFVHAYAHVMGEPEHLIEVASGGPDDWLGATPIDPQLAVVPLVPAGLLDDPERSVDVAVTLGPLQVEPDFLLRRLSVEAPGITPEVRCDLSISPSSGHGARLRLVGTYDAERGPLDRSRTEEAVEALANALIVRMASRVGG